MFAVVGLLNEMSAQMGVADVVASLLKLWSGRCADVRPQRRKAMVLIGYGLALASRPLIGIASHWGTGRHRPRCAARDAHEAIMLDLMLPGLDGLELCPRLRRALRRSTPVLQVGAHELLLVVVPDDVSLAR